MPKDFKILLINPSYPRQLYTTTDDVHAAMERKPPLGILSVGTYLRDKSDFELRLLDNELAALNDNELTKLLTDYRPDVVGISVVSFKLYSAYRMTEIVKKALPETHVCWGGPHLSIYPKESLGLKGVDSIVLGDGEVPFLQLCQNLSNGKQAYSIPGVYTPATTGVDTEFSEHIYPDLNALPLPDITLLPYKKYRAFLTNDLMATAVTSRGCPFRCIFCKLSFSHIRLISIERVAELVETYARLGIREIEFYDETFNINTKRATDFALKLIDKNIRIRWSFRGRVDAVDEEMLAAIKKAGCQRIQYGVEAGSDRVLKILKKGIDVAQIRRCFELTNKAKIDTVAYFILGSPDETLEEMDQTLNLARSIRPTYLEYAIFNISPGTESYRMALDQGVLKDDVWRKFAASPGPEMPVLPWTKDYTYEQLEEIRRKALRDFYARPGYIVNRLFKIRPKEALRIFKTGLNILKDIR